MLCIESGPLSLFGNIGVSSTLLVQQSFRDKTDFQVGSLEISMS